MLPAPIARNVVPPGYFALWTLDPFRGRRGKSLVPVGTTLGQALEAEGSQGEEYCRAFIGDLLVSDWDHWRQLRPLEGSTVSVCWVPGCPLTVVIVILLVIALAAAITNLVLTLTAKQQDRDQQSRFDSPSLRGARNQVALHEPIPKIYGRYRTKPPLGAYTYTEIVGSDHFLRCLFVVGYGPLIMDVADMRIGETPVSQFQDIEIEVRPGELDDPPITLYPSQVTQEDFGITLSDQNMAPEDVIPGEIPGSTGWQQRTSDLSTDELGIELTLPSGIGNITGKGQNQPTRVVHLIEYRQVGTTTWLRPTAASMRISSLAQKRNDGEVVIDTHRLGFFSVGINFQVPTRDQYEVRIKNTESAGIDVEGHNQFFHETRWIALKSFRNEAPWTKKGIAMIGLRIRASDQLQGTIDDFSVIARAKLPTWDGTQWTAPIETRNTAWAYADVLRGAANPDPIPDDLIDADRLKEWADQIEAHTVPDEMGTPTLNPMYFDGVIDFRSTVYRMLSDLAAVARASPHMRDGRFSVTFDHDRTDETPVQMITPRNIVSGSYAGRKVFFEEADAYRVGIKNAAKDYGDDEIIMFTPGFTAATARVYEKIEWLGITDPNRAVDETRFMVAARRYRPEVHRFDMDLENMVFERGDLVLFSHDAPLLGLAYGRIASLGSSGGLTTGFTLDEKVVFEPGVNYGVRIRRHHSVLDVLDSLPVTNPATEAIDVETNSILLVTPLGAGSEPSVGDLVSFGELGIETRRCIVRSITPGNELTATIELEDEGDQIWGDLTQPIPPYDPGINRPGDLPPLAPEIVSVQAPDHLNLIVTFRLLSGFGRSVTRCEIQVRVSPDGPWQDVPPVAPGGLVVAVIPGLTLDVHYDVRVRAVSASGLFSPWVQWPEPFLHSSHAINITRYSIADLRLENILNDPTQFVGPSPQFRWQIQVIDGTDLGDPVSDAPRQASIVRESEIDRFDGYLVRILEAVWNADLNAYVPGDMIDETVVQDHRYSYTFDHNQDDGGPRRVLFFEVAAQIDGLLTESALQLAVNPPPELPELVQINGLAATRIEIELATESLDADWEGFLIWTSKTAGFTPNLDTLRFRGRIDKVLQLAAEPETTYYIRYASFDRFSSDPAVLNLSDEIVVTTLQISGVVGEQIHVGIAYGSPFVYAQLANWPPATRDANIPPWFTPSDQISHHPYTLLSYIAKSTGTLQITWQALWAVTGSGTHIHWAVGWGSGPTPPTPPTEIYLFGTAALGAGAWPVKNISFVGTPGSPLTPLASYPADKFSHFYETWTLEVVAGQTYWFDFFIHTNWNNSNAAAFYDTVIFRQVAE